MTPAQCRAARALLGWSQSKLAKNAVVGHSTVADFERGARVPHWRTVEALRETLETMGCEFFADRIVHAKVVSEHADYADKDGKPMPRAI